MILVVDFGSQTAHLIHRRVRDLGVDVTIIDPGRVMDAIAERKPDGIILSGGPSSVYTEGAPSIDPAVFSAGIPILGICYGWQLTAKMLGGTVVGGNKEFGPTRLGLKATSVLFSGVTEPSFTVWMSHGDEVVGLPHGFRDVASSDRVSSAAAEDAERRVYGVQFHPEVTHTEHGSTLIRNFIERVCGCAVSPRVIDVEDAVAAVRHDVDQAGGGMVIAAVSGGVDSTVAAAIVARAIGKRFIPVYCDNGLMRVGTRERVEHIFRDILGVPPVIVDCRRQFLDALAGVTDPEVKRKAIGKTYIDVFERESVRHEGVRFLMQGTIYSDIIESKGSSLASKIKSHHNVGGLPEHMNLTLLEPIKSYYKDEVRQLGRQLGLPEDAVMEQPFPGPGYAIRILGEVTEARLAMEAAADAIVLDVLKNSGWYGKVFQSFPVLTGTKTTAVKGDARVYGELVGLRVYDSSDIMTAGVTELPYAVLAELAGRIVNEVPGVARVVYDVTTKPPATMEWE